ncbi:MAG TPA: hypothetical protein VG052_00685 [Puia sp.]|jgi:hypothetical protein|nr:hypothetical protein [Puia sp.]
MKTTILLFVISLGIIQARASDGSKDHEKSAPAVHNILSNQLPSRLLTVIKKTYKDYWITDLYKESLNGKVSYYITLENADQKVKLNTTHSITWAVARVVSKDIAAR